MAGLEAEGRTSSCLVQSGSILNQRAGLSDTPSQATTVMDLIEGRWEEWIGEMPLKITYPTLEGHEWRIVTGFDPKNTGWSRNL
ncbi:hypothetical protein H5410_006898 [Solanum commersonii]|uniref:Beta-fructofuranosidase n=1 Tax=Solanum commersonii TaxID=4109 RepID=A0A9J6AB15_SOLCO|nr:hypothetical protein H5410_006898 [Solanum commersonii]